MHHASRALVLPCIKFARSSRGVTSPRKKLKLLYGAPTPPTAARPPRAMRVVTHPTATVAPTSFIIHHFIFAPLTTRSIILV